jgi:hypothetical protein
VPLIVSATRDADEHAARCRDEQLRDGPDEFAGRPAHRGDPGAEDEESDGIVEEALSLQDGGGPARQVERPQRGGGCRGVRRRDDRSERDGGRDRKSGHRPTHPCDGCCREHDGEEREHQHGQPLLPQLSWRHVVCGVEERRRDEEREREARMKGDARRPRQRREERAGECQHRRIRHPQPPRYLEQRHRYEQ